MNMYTKIWYQLSVSLKITTEKLTDSGPIIELFCDVIMHCHLFTLCGVNRNHWFTGCRDFVSKLKYLSVDHPSLVICSSRLANLPYIWLSTEHSLLWFTDQWALWICHSVQIQLMLISCQIQRCKTTTTWYSC